MKVMRNEKHTKSRARVGQWASLGGMAVLGLGLLISFTRPQLIGISFACLLVGLALSQVGLYFTKRWVQRPRPDEVLESALKGFSNRFELYSFYLPAPHVLLGPSGLFVLRVQPQEGQITHQAGRWHQKFSVARFMGFSGQETVGDPTREAQSEAQNIAAFLAEHLPDEKIAVQPLIVFTNDKAELSISEPPIPVLPHKKLKSYLRGPGKGYLPSRQLELLSELFAAQVS
ncbi:MAG: nuclease-related domain-containing protein [Chloroflexota bacterium]|nr:nuclease-related domain-containing protein [Chloroflexota bacterium]